jgi:hypothetical protein
MSKSKLDTKPSTMSQSSFQVILSAEKSLAREIKTHLEGIAQTLQYHAEGRRPLDPHTVASVEDLPFVSHSLPLSFLHPSSFPYFYFHCVIPLLHSLIIWQLYDNYISICEELLEQVKEDDVGLVRHINSSLKGISDLIGEAMELVYEHLEIFGKAIRV